MMQNVNKIIQNLQQLSSERYKQLELTLAILQEENERLQEQIETLSEGDKNGNK